MALNHFITLLVIAAMAAIPHAKAQLGLINGLLGSVNVQGTVFCTSKDNMSVKGLIDPVFSNAQVEVVCGGKEISNARTDENGKFSIMMEPLLLDLSSLLNGCNIVVATPLSNCNTNLPSAGALISTLQFAGITRIGTQTITDIIPSGFHFVPST